ncbi:MAG TPA: lysylphosphatidylglycerol synthase transmembrane domain-containing protein [Bacteroidales bacterium]|nr:MAG: hypothetical protein BWX62_00307 [Bacteroidetes bacterium ADurb.Bin037]HPV87912.1 lysylphosphatidylglycerol synthase transmembrane domain-containing protein [Bacteroidales bacterium]HPW78534.1 lysylphosphatidylglycerol synthase transmembrane domain-containing protein [Bacteroidales bacterium]HQB55745.1 lysylphosphatidylglycerol synthase transmembrane domain-containing protein [Bacteroidales bacterium]
MKWKKTLKVLLFATLALVLLYFSFRGIHWSDFINGLRSVDYFWIVMSILVGAFSFYVRAARWRIILLGLGKPVKRIDTFNGVGMAYLTNFALPRAGEVARCGVVAQRTGLGFDKVLGTVVMERTFDVLCLLIITVAVAFLRMDVFGHFMITRIWDPFIERLGGSALTAVVLVISIPLLLIVIGYIFRKQLGKLTITRKICEFFAGIWKGLVQSFKMPRKGYFFFLTVLMWFLYVCTSYCTILATSLRGQLTLIDALFLMVVGSFGWVVPVQGGIGAFHFIVSLALMAVYGLTQTGGMVFATISHESQAFTMLLTGLFAIIYMSVTNKTKRVKQ